MKPPRRIGCTKHKNSSRTEWGPWRDVTHRADLTGYPDAGRLLAWYVNRIYSVRLFSGKAVFPTYDSEPGRLCGTVSLSICRLDGRPVHSWWDFEHIKDDLVGADAVAVEVYPRARDVVDPSNLYYLWVLPKGFVLPFNLVPPSAEMKAAAHPAFAAPIRGRG